MNNSPCVYIVVVTYNGRRFLERCLGTLLDTDYANFRVVLVDNGSSDGSGEFARERFPKVDVIRKVPNEGYASGANFGIRHALEQGADYVAIFNDDTAICDERWLAEAVRCHKARPEIGVIGFEDVAEILTPDCAGTIELEEGELLGGFALVFSSESLVRVGLYDEAYFIYCDEDDLQDRLKAAGYRSARLSIPIYHFGSGTTGRLSRRSAYLQMRNGLRLCLKHRGLWPATLRLGRILDVACNPWPRTMNRDDVAHVRMRNTGNVVVNAWLCGRAVAWNLIHLPRTLSIARTEARRIEAPRHGAGEVGAIATTGASAADVPLEVQRAH